MIYRIDILSYLSELTLSDMFAWPHLIHSIVGFGSNEWIRRARPCKSSSDMYYIACTKGSSVLHWISFSVWQNIYTRHRSKIMQVINPLGKISISISFLKCPLWALSLVAVACKMTKSIHLLWHLPHALTSVADHTLWPTCSCLVLHVTNMQVFNVLHWDNMCTIFCTTVHNVMCRLSCTLVHWN